jgi:glutamate/tyrosine decarboxylase-like PLP-dependent enzyme
MNEKDVCKKKNLKKTNAEEFDLEEFKNKINNDFINLKKLETFAIEIGNSFLNENKSANVVNAGHSSPIIFPHLQDNGSGAEVALKTYWAKYGAQHSRSSGPRYFGFVTGGVTPAALMADILVPFLDQNVATERNSIAAYIETLALSQVLDLLNLPRDVFSGSLVTGTSAANLVCLAGARQWCGKRAGYDIAKLGMAGAPTITVFTSTAHSSIIKAMGILGFGQQNICKVTSLPDREAIDPEALKIALENNKSHEKIVIANAGTVNTGDFDSLTQIADLCAKYHAWMHVDGAFGAFSRTMPSHQFLGEGIERADSLSVDGHKWLNLPYDCGLAFSRHMSQQESSFAADAPYVPLEGVLPAWDRAI